MIRSISDLHENERLIGFTQTPLGQVLMLLLATWLFLWHSVSNLMIIALAVVMVLPSRRRIVLSVVAVGVIAEIFLSRTSVHLSMGSLFASSADRAFLGEVIVKTVVVLGGLYAAFIVARGFARFPAFVRRAPLLLLHIGLWAALFASSIVGIGLYSLGPFIAWRLSYLFAQAKSGRVTGSGFQDHLFYLMPVFGGTPTPYGKGLEYLGRHEARDRKAIAQSQLAGVKLLILAIIWSWVLRLMDALLYGEPDDLTSDWFGGRSAGMVRLEAAMQPAAEISVAMSWASVFLELVYLTLVLAVAGHIIIGCLRLLGFNVFRNTYKPLLSETVADFWSRYYFYFKELLVDLFFYPAFLGNAWAGRRLRLFVAVFSAAFVGNMYFHLLVRFDAVVSFDSGALWSELGPRLVYCWLLAVGIWLSMLRQERRRAEPIKPGRLARLRRIAAVWLFFGLINIWNIESADLGFAERFQFMLQLGFM